MSACTAGTISSRGTSTPSISARAFLSTTQDPTLAASTVAGATSYAATNPDLVRGYRGYSSMASTSRFYEGWRTFHSIQLSFNRRFRDGLQFGFNDTITLSDVARVAPRFDHTSDGQFVRRADEAAGAGAARQPDARTPTS